MSGLKTIAVIIGLVAIAVIVVGAAHLVWGYRYNHRRVKPPKPPVAYDVAEVETGASLLVARGRRQLDVSLWGVAAPSETQRCYAESRANLKQLAGEWIRVEEKGSLHPAVKCEGGKCESSRRHVVIIGIAYGQAGQCLQLEQLRAGFVRVLDGMPAEWRAAEAEARKARRGIWQATE